MDCRGQIKQVLGIDGKDLNILLTLHDIDPHLVNDLANKDLAIVLKQYKPKRSLDANALLWAVLCKMADILKTSKEELYENILQRYGVPYQDDEGYITVTLKDNVDVSKVGGHWKWIRSRNGFSSYIMLKGTSEYDSGEMSKLIDLVIEDAKELGVEIPPSEDMKRALELWEKEKS